MPSMNDALELRQPRTVEQLVAGQPTQDVQRRLDPFLMLDAFGSDKPDDYIAGFPTTRTAASRPSPTCSPGRMRHRDSAGHEGLLVPTAACSG
jgi:redox-sensitive bicupin YhaK (pirin superfamily)